MHSRVLCLNPPPHDAEQRSYLDHLLHTPSALDFIQSRGRCCLLCMTGRFGIGLRSGLRCGNCFGAGFDGIGFLAGWDRLGAGCGAGFGAAFGAGFGAGFGFGLGFGLVVFGL